MLRRLFTVRWLGWLAALVLVSIACVLLGMWQWGRYEDKLANAERVTSHYEADPVPVTDVLGTGPMPIAKEWTRVRASGHYLPKQRQMVRNRPLNGTYGYEVLTPLRLDDGSVLVVDRGWVANSPKGADVIPSVPPAPKGEVTVTGWLRQGEDSLDRDMPAGQLASIRLPTVESRLGEPVLGGYLELQSEDPDVARPKPLEPPDTGTGPHLAYAIQWWLGPFGLGVFFVIALRREVAGEQDGSERPAKPAKPKKVRIWDEEDG